MSQVKNYFVSKDNGKLQMPYRDYVALVEKMEEAKRIVRVGNEVLARLGRFLDGEPRADLGMAAKQSPVAPPKPAEPDLPDEAPPPSKEEKPIPPTAKSRTKLGSVQIPPIKKEIVDHFNNFDESGRLSSVFVQYYACLNEACGGTVRVTMKDGVCSLLNYDEWEEFAFVDIFEGELRFALDPRYRKKLSTLDFCEVPRLLSTRGEFVCVHLGDLDKTMLKVLTKAFGDVGKNNGVKGENHE